MLGTSGIEIEGIDGVGMLIPNEGIAGADIPSGKSKSRSSDGTSGIVKEGIEGIGGISSGIGIF
jgi:hypothetical protein